VTLTQTGGQEVGGLKPGNAVTLQVVRGVPANEVNDSKKKRHVAGKGLEWRGQSEGLGQLTRHKAAR